MPRNKLLTSLVLIPAATFAADAVVSESGGTATANVGYNAAGNNIQSVTVVFKTPETGVETKTLVVQGMGYDETKAKMNSDIAASTAFDGAQWVKGKEEGFKHTYSITNVKSPTPLAVAVTGLIKEKALSGTGRGPAIGGRKTNINVSAPYAATISSTTRLSAPDGTADTRLTVGVGEEINFVVTDTHLGHPAVSLSGIGAHLEVKDVSGTQFPSTKEFRFVSDGTPGSYNIQLTFNAAGTVSMNGVSRSGSTVTITVTVIKPSGESIEKETPQPIYSFPAKEAAVMMQLIYRPLPRSVNFSKVDVKELGAPDNMAAGQPVGATGYFANLNAAVPGCLVHYPTAEWFNYSEDLYWPDMAGWRPISQSKFSAEEKEKGLAVPYSAGSFSWRIPVVWKCKLSGQQNFYTRIQTFTMNSTGGMTVRKTDTAGKTESATRNL